MSQQYLNSQVISLKSTSDADTKMYYLFKFDTNYDQSVVIADADAECVGVLQNKPKAGEAASLAVGISTKVILGDTVTRGDLVVSDSAGKAVPRGSARNVFGKALESGVVNDIIEVLVTKFYK